MFDMLCKRVKGNLTVLLQYRNLTGYALAGATSHEKQTAITQISQRVNVVIGGLTQIVEEIRGQRGKLNNLFNLKTAPSADLPDNLTPDARADLGQRTNRPESAQLKTAPGADLKNIATASLIISG